METKFKFIQTGNFIKLLDNLNRKYQVVLPFGDNDYLWEVYRQKFEYNRYRPITSIRQFFTPATEHTSDYFDAQGKTKKPFCIVGAKSCDLTSLLIQDYVFLQGEIDEQYNQMRRNNLIISSDCTAFKDVCFCLALEINPYPEQLFDLNISQVQGGYIAEIASGKGLNTVTDYSELFEEISDKHLSERKYRRQEIVHNLSCHLDPQNLAQKNMLYSLTKNGYSDGIWANEALRCVECGACIMNCPTCHCFLLFDTKRVNEYLRSRIWDGCQYKNFTRVAGGASALRFREHRLRNRYIKKFEFFYEKINVYACTGCGRCIESCPAKIDLREIFKTLLQNTDGHKILKSRE